MSKPAYAVSQDARFDGLWRSRCAIESVSQQTLAPLIAQHYLEKPPAITRCCLLMTCDLWNVGMVIFADAPHETSVRYGGLTWELARLWIDDMIPRNGETWLIGQAIKYVRRHYPDVKYLVSYADPSAGHRGTIYRASNWRDDGRTDQERKSPRCDYVDGTGKKYSRRGHVPAGIVVTRQPRVSKYRFVYDLNGKG